MNAMQGLMCRWGRLTERGVSQGRRAALIVVALLALSACFSQVWACSEMDGIVVAGALALAHPFADESVLYKMVQENKALFSANSSVIACARKLGNRLVSAGLKSYDPKAADRAARSGGPAELVPDVARELNAFSLEASALGQELNWLAGVLPAMAAGDMVPFNTTASPQRAQIRQLLPLIKPFLQNPLMAEIVKQQQRDTFQQTRALATATP